MADGIALGYKSASHSLSNCWQFVCRDMVPLVKTFFVISWSNRIIRVLGFHFDNGITMADNGHHSDTVMGTMASQSTGAWIVYSTVFQAYIKETIKAPREWPLWVEFTGDRLFPPQRVSNVDVYTCNWWRHHATLGNKRQSAISWL